ncbi:Major facilitator superfamily domain general substrate transporter [Penicillium cf. griseofulvum]|uniref:Major facilitator superfamily domain general substrate transporter n=1 Tax=Penicillium cf. griseofulvum TaxID=2972120 RepID=A0A9W9J2G4_9EURO|nr:Major facilitator superfamily domain general substrate transporter [Penicillium cf. griseofulvum]KAJ5452168.1 Major facilitator superfamily domain general substrate transporter [Penicillium cf. griseofulvum]
MGVINLTRGRKDNVIVEDLRPTQENEKTDINVEQNIVDDGLNNLCRAEKEIREHPDVVSANAADGVRKAEAVALVWSKKAVFATYAWIWVCFFMLALHSSIGSNVLYYAYSNFQNASQVSTATILASIVGGVLKLPIGKILTLWGRAEGLIIFTGVYILGIIILAACNNANTYAAGYVLYWVGYDAIYIILDIFIADTSGMRNRAFAFAFASTPFICTSFTGPLAATHFLKTSNWRWAYGSFAIIMPFVFLPLAGVFKFYEKKARKMGVLQRPVSGRTTMQSILHYLHEFDIIGAFILMAAFILFLLPFSLANYGRAQYGEAAFIAPLVIGFFLFFAFAAWEKWVAHAHFIPYQLFKDRTVFGACSLSAILYFSFYSWDLYYYYFVMVVYNFDVTTTGYMTAIYTVGSCFWSPIFGLWIRYVKEFKYTCLFFALPLMALGAGLMIHFRGSGSDIGYVIMCQIFIAFAGGMMVIGEQMAVMCASDREGIPMMISLVSLFSNLGGAIGYAVSAAIYANTFPQGLREALPERAKDQWATIYAGGYVAQMKYLPGTEERDAINFAYGYSQKYGCIAATAILVLAVPCIGMWKHYRVDKEQNKGTVL